MLDAALTKEDLFTYADYKAWELAPGERYELIDGVAYAMAAPNVYHQAVSMELSSQFHVFFMGRHFCKVATLNRKIVLDWKAKLRAAQ
jgi:Uma2 family endonuclease